MKRSSIKKRKSYVNGQTLVDIKETSKRDTKVSFADEVNKLQLKLLTNINPKSKNKNKNKEEPSSQDDQIPVRNKRYSVSIPSSNFRRFNIQEENKNNSFKNNNNRNKLNSEVKGKNKKNAGKRYSMRVTHNKYYEENFGFNKNKGELAAIKEIIIPDSNENIVTNNPKKRFQINKNDEEKKNKKVNLIDELRKFDRDEQTKMEIYLENKRKKENELMYKKSNLYKKTNKRKTDGSITEENRNNNFKNENESKENDDENSQSSNTIEKKLKEKTVIITTMIKKEIFRN